MYRALASISECPALAGRITLLQVPSQALREVRVTLAHLDRVRPYRSVATLQAPEHDH